MRPVTKHVLLALECSREPAYSLAEMAAIRCYQLPQVVDTNAYNISPAYGQIASERERQIIKGYDAVHDDQHDMLELADCVLDYLPGEGSNEPVTRENCIKAAAVLVAMIEKFDREQPQDQPKENEDASRNLPAQAQE